MSFFGESTVAKDKSRPVQMLWPFWGPIRCSLLYCLAGWVGFWRVHSLGSLPERAWFGTNSRAVAKQERGSLATVALPNKENLSPQLFPMQHHHCSCQLLLTAEGNIFIPALIRKLTSCSCLPYSFSTCLLFCWHYVIKNDTTSQGDFFHTAAMSQ